jgi:WD40 repeat protein
MIESKAHLLDAQTNDNLLGIQIRNAEDELVDIIEDLRLEQGELLQRGLMKQSIRLMALNSCGQTDESENADDYSLLIALTIGKDVFVYDSVTGTALNVFEGDILSEGSNRIIGHTAIITSLYLKGKFIYSGSKDTTVRCWNIATNQMEYVAEGHDATITSVYCTTTMLISGSADKRMMIWDKTNGDILRELNGHSRGVLALCEGNSTIVSGDADGDILVWDANNVSALLYMQCS